MKKIKLVCPTCGSTRVKRSVYTTWNVDTQKFEISEQFGYTCESCCERYRDDPDDQYWRLVSKDYLEQVPAETPVFSLDQDDWGTSAVLDEKGNIVAEFENLEDAYIDMVKRNTSARGVSFVVPGTADCLSGGLV